MDVSGGAPERAAGTERSGRWKADLPVGIAVMIGCLLLGAPTGLLWAAIAPRATVQFSPSGPQVPDFQSTKAFIGADGSFLFLALVVGLVCGGLAWWLARRSGPWTVAGLVVGGLLGGLVASRVGLLPRTDEILAALATPGRTGSVELYLGRPGDDGLRMRAPWTVVAWPVGALLAFLAGALRRPEDLD